MALSAPRGSRQPAAPGTVTPHVAMSWAQRLKRVFGIDIETCERCGGAVEIITSIENPLVIERYWRTSDWNGRGGAHCRWCARAARDRGLNTAGAVGGLLSSCRLCFSGIWCKGRAVGQLQRGIKKFFHAIRWRGEECDCGT
jgi:hypothetical protein